MKTHPRLFAARVAAECETGAGRVLALQAAFGDELMRADLSSRMMAEMQALDALHQTLVDLGQVFARLAHDSEGDCVRRGIPDAAVAEAKQAALRDRLKGIMKDRIEIDANGGIELF